MMRNLFKGALKKTPSKEEVAGIQRLATRYQEAFDRKIELGGEVLRGTQNFADSVDVRPDEDRFGVKFIEVITATNRYRIDPARGQILKRNERTFDYEKSNLKDAFENLSIFLEDISQDLEEFTKGAKERIAKIRYDAAKEAFYKDLPDSQLAKVIKSDKPEAEKLFLIELSTSSFNTPEGKAIKSLTERHIFENDSVPLGQEYEDRLSLDEKRDRAGGIIKNIYKSVIGDNPLSEGLPSISTMYHKLSHKFHPDRNNSKIAKTLFTIITNAYDICEKGYEHNLSIASVAARPYGSQPIKVDSIKAAIDSGSDGILETLIVSAKKNNLEIGLFKSIIDQNAKDILKNIRVIELFAGLSDEKKAAISAHCASVTEVLNPEIPAFFKVAAQDFTPEELPEYKRQKFGKDITKGLHDALIKGVSGVLSEELHLKVENGQVSFKIPDPNFRDGLRSIVIKEDGTIEARGRKTHMMRELTPETSQTVSKDLLELLDRVGLDSKVAKEGSHSPNPIFAPTSAALVAARGLGVAIR